MLVLVVLATISGALSFQWTSSNILPNGTVVQVCDGDNLTLSWTFNLTSSEQLYLMEWRRSFQDRRTSLAIYHDEEFFKKPEGERVGVEFLPNAGLFLPSVTVSDSGYYEVHLSVLHPPRLYKYSQTALVHVSDSGPYDFPGEFYNCSCCQTYPDISMCHLTKMNIKMSIPHPFFTPPTIDGGLHAYILPVGDFQAITGTWHVQLGCGKFLSLGHPTVNVVWNTPSQQKVNSTSFTNNTFILTLANPVEEGDYSCLLERTSPAAECVDSHSLLRHEATVRVHGINTRLSLIEGGLEALREETINLSRSVKEDAICKQEMTAKKYETDLNIIRHTTKNLAINVSDLTANSKKLTGSVSTIEKQIQSILSEFQLKEKEIANITISQSEFEKEMKGLWSNITEMVLSLEARLKGQTTLGANLQQKTVRSPKSCADVLKFDNKSGIHTLYLSTFTTINVFCDQKTDNGGWTVIQRRQNGSVDFYRNWEDYEVGFGDLTGEFWIGLSNLHSLTKDQKSILRVDLVDFNGSTVYAVYNTFFITGASDNYTLQVHGYRGNAGDSLKSHNGMQFTTFDRDHDLWGDNCARSWHGAWWYKACHDSNLNGRYKSDGAHGSNGVMWRYFKNDSRSFKRVEMKLKPSNG